MTIQDETITAWGTRRVEAVGGNVTISQVLCELLESLGVEQAFAIVGGGNAPFAEALLKSPIELIHARHEGGAAFAATEASMVSGRPTAVTVTTGPGLLNALTGICGARWDGAKVILFSGISSFAHKGLGAVQETSSYTMPSEGLFRAGPFFDFAVELNDSEELPEIARRLAIGCQRPGGFVAHIALPLRLQTTLIPARGAKPASRLLTTGGDPAAARTCANRLNEGHFAVWVGHGARHASEPLRELV
ncbi:MAG TPA: thiamine pyrophosphate-binding protein, partial [Polyangiaceae bacterium]